MTLEEEIYAVLVERFGVGEICIKSHGKRPKLTWIQFIKLALEVEVGDLFKYCGISAPGFSTYFDREFSLIKEAKCKRQWRPFLLSLISTKRCNACGIIKSTKEFSKAEGNIDLLYATCKSCDKKYRERNKDSISLRSKIYYNNNKAAAFAHSAKRRATKLNATPNWADLVAIKEIYATCPEGYHVDHIIPLQNDLVCGLHCEFNLQHLSAHDNLSKGNKYEP